MVYVLLAEGFEEIEAIAPIDILRRAGAEVKTVGVTGSSVTGAHGIPVTADLDGDLHLFDDLCENDAILLPGGMPGTRNLEESIVVHKAIDTAVTNGAVIAAICAAPSILGHKQLLHGKKVVCFPGYEKDLVDATVLHTQVCEDGKLITGNGPGAAFEFGLLLAERLCGANPQELKDGMMIK